MIITEIQSPFQNMGSSMSMEKKMDRSMKILMIPLVNLILVMETSLSPDI